MTQLVAFDLDGTLLDTAQDFFLSVNILRSRHGIEEASFNEVRSRVSEGPNSLASYAMRMEAELKEGDTKDGISLPNKKLEPY